MIGVVGASARAAVHSLARAGLSAWAVDLFGDRDLRSVAPCAVCPADRYPDALPELAARFRLGPVLYTGGLENYPSVVAELSRTRELWGNPPEVLAAARDPFALAALFARAGFRVPRLIPPGEPCPRTGGWLRKPLRSSGGLGIRPARPGEPTSQHHYIQEFVEGVPMSAQFVSDLAETDAWPDGTVMLGVTEQLIGEPWLHAPPFAFCGAIGPIQLQPAFEAKLVLDALVANRALRLRGLWGLDWILRDGSPVPVELNPRYTAAVETLELAWGCSFASLHRDCFQGTNALAKYNSWQRWDTPVGKAVYYAPHAITFPHSGPWDADLAQPFDPWRVPGFADIPVAGAAIEAGHPVLTIFARGSSPAEVRERLQSRAAELDRLSSGSRQ